MPSSVPKSARQPASSDPGVARELAAARKRIAELDAREAQQQRAVTVQAALYRIAETASSAQDMQAFYAKIHEIVGGLVYADNFYVALYDAKRQAINFPYMRDTVDQDIPDPNAWDPFGIGDARGSTAYVLRHGKPEHFTLADIQRLIQQGEMEAVGAETVVVDWRPAEG